MYLMCSFDGNLANFCKNIGNMINSLIGEFRKMLMPDIFGGVNDVPQTAWVCAAKKSGEIASAYCTCVAGLVTLLWCFVLHYVVF